jgi:hypothetical protein
MRRTSGSGNSCDNSNVNHLVATNYITILHILHTISHVQVYENIRQKDLATGGKNYDGVNRSAA